MTPGGANTTDNGTISDSVTQGVVVVIVPYGGQAQVVRACYVLVYGRGWLPPDLIGVFILNIVQADSKNAF